MIDIGCGVLGILPQLRSQVGHGGRVAGLDIEPRTGRDFHTGRRAARLLRDADLRDVQVRIIARLTAPGDYFQTFLLTLANLMREEILAGGRVTPGRLDSAAELRDHLSRPGTLTCLPPSGRPGTANPGTS